MGSAWHEVTVFDRVGLMHEVEGPALVQEAYTTVWIAPGWRCGPGAQGDLVARRVAA